MLLWVPLALVLLELGRNILGPTARGPQCPPSQRPSIPKPGTLDIVLIAATGPNGPLRF